MTAHVLTEQERQDIRALGRLGWSLRNRGEVDEDPARKTISDRGRSVEDVEAA